MDYREYAKDLLKRKNGLSTAYRVIKDELAGLEAEKCACKTTMLNLPDDRGSRSAEERLVNIIVRIEDCRMRMRVVERELTMLEQGMGALSDYHRDLLDGFFINRRQGVCEELMEKYYRERSGIYRDRSKALEEFTRSVYGVLQL